MKKLILSAAFAFMLVACSEPIKLEVSGDWKFKEHVTGTASLNPQQQAMVTSISNLFRDGEISMHDGNISIKSPLGGNRSGTYTVKDGRLSTEFGANNQIILNDRNEGEHLVVLFGDATVDELGKLVLEKK